jgi:folate-binding protein YgfZ
MSAPPGPHALERALEAARTGAVVCDDTALGLLVVSGADAASFLHAQLSSDVRNLGPAAGQWTSYNSPKGRMLATAYLYRRASADGDAFVALLSRDLVQSIVRRLSMFVLRSKATIVDASADHRVLGVGGPKAAAAIDAAFGRHPPPGGVDANGGIDVVALPDGRFVIVSAGERAPTALAALATHAQPVPAEVWRWLAVQSGVAVVDASTQDAFVPQTANWDAIGGLDFRKGCYPGQEIVARTQYLGRLKERLFRFASEAPPPPAGTRLYGEAFDGQASGTVVISAPSPSGGSEFLAVVQQAALESGPLAIGGPEGIRAVPLPLPYDLPAPSVRPPRL